MARNHNSVQSILDHLGKAERFGNDLKKQISNSTPNSAPNPFAEAWAAEDQAFVDAAEMMTMGCRTDIPVDRYLELQKRLCRVEAKVDKLLNHFERQSPLALSPSEMAEGLALIRRSREQ